MKKPLNGLKKYLNKRKIDSYWKRRTKIKDMRISTHFKKDDTYIYDLKLIDKYISKKSIVLDLACGTCYLSNKLITKVKFIKAVDKFGKFLEFCNKSNNLVTIEKDILNFKDDIKYDVILLFGIVTYLNDDEVVQLYDKCKKLLKKNGVLLIKHQSGIKKDILVDNYSSKIKDHYHAVYRHIAKEIQLLKLFFKTIKVVDIYPKKLNPWPNTHFYAYVCKI